MTNILITGGCGFIGSNLAFMLARSKDHFLTVLDDDGAAGRSLVNVIPEVRFVQGDVRNSAIVAQAVEGQDVVVHLAARISVVESIKDPVGDFDVNVRGSLNLLAAARAAEVGRVVFASSVAPLGNAEPPARESLAPRPSSPYGAAKSAVEGYCSAFYHSYGLETVALRFSNAYGPGKIDQPGVIAHFIRNILRGKSLTIFGSGEQTRDFLYIDDLCRMIVSVIEHQPASPEMVFGNVYQVGTGRETSINELVQRLDRIAAAKAMGTVKTIRQPERRGEIVRSYCDATRFTKVFGCVSTCSLEIGLEKTWDYLQQAVVMR